MSDDKKRLVILMTQGLDNERSSVALTIANGAITSGREVLVFLTSSAVDLVRKRAIDLAHVPPLDPLRDLMKSFLERGGTVVACPPCVKSRGYTADDFIEGVRVQGATAMFEQMDMGAQTLSF